MLLTHGAASQPGGSPHAQQSGQGHGHANPHVFPQEPAQPTRQASAEADHQQHAAPQFRNGFAQEQSCRHADDQQRQVAPTRHDPAGFDGAVGVIQQRGDAVGVDFHPGDLEHLLCVAETGVGNIEQIPQRRSCAADHHDLVANRFGRHLSIQELGQ